MKKICAITGSNGYVGGCVKNYFAAHGWDILELTRQPKPGTRAVKFQLGEEISNGDARRCGCAGALRLRFQAAALGRNPAR